MSDLKGYAQMQARLRAVEKAPGQIVRNIVIRGVGNAKRKVKRKTGNLGRTIRPGRITETTGEVVAGGRLKVGYAEAVEKGTRPHVIRPRNKKALAWGGKRRLSGTLRTGEKATNFAMVVNHPGTRAYPFLLPGLQEAVKDEGVDAVVLLWNGAA